MDLQYWIWIAVGLSFTLYIGIAIWSRASSTKEFYVAGSGVHPLMRVIGLLSGLASYCNSLFYFFIKINLNPRKKSSTSLPSAPRHYSQK